MGQFTHSSQKVGRTDKKTARGEESFYKINYDVMAEVNSPAKAQVSVYLYHYHM